MQTKGQKTPRTAPSEPTDRLIPAGTSPQGQTPGKLLTTYSKSRGGITGKEIQDLQPNYFLSVYTWDLHTVKVRCLFWRYIPPFPPLYGNDARETLNSKTCWNLLILTHFPPVVPWGGLKSVQQLWLYPNISTKNLTDVLPRKCYDPLLTQFACVLLKQLYAVKLVFLMHLPHSFPKTYFTHSSTLNCILL